MLFIFAKIKFSAKGNGLEKYTALSHFKWKKREISMELKKIYVQKKYNLELIHGKNMHEDEEKCKYRKTEIKYFGHRIKNEI